MSGIFGGAKPQPMQPPPPPPPVPSYDDAAAKADDATKAIRARRGMASNILAGASGSATQPATTNASSQLLGQ